MRVGQYLSLKNAAEPAFIERGFIKVKPLLDFRGIKPAIIHDVPAAQPVFRIVINIDVSLSSVGATFKTICSGTGDSYGV